MSEDLSGFNVVDPEGRRLCPACGFPGYFWCEIYDSSGGIIGSGICPCCFYEPGFDDDPGVGADAKETVALSIKAYRDGWISGGMPWRGSHHIFPIPERWNGQAQLDHLTEVAPALF